MFKQKLTWASLNLRSKIFVLYKNIFVFQFRVEVSYVWSVLVLISELLKWPTTKNIMEISRISRRFSKLHTIRRTVSCDLMMPSRTTSFCQRKKWPRIQRINIVLFYARRLEKSRGREETRWTRGRKGCREKRKHGSRAKSTKTRLCSHGSSRIKEPRPFR